MCKETSYLLYRNEREWNEHELVQMYNFDDDLKIGETDTRCDLIFS
jgi:hypothetical protein